MKKLLEAFSQLWKKEKPKTYSVYDLVSLPVGSFVVLELKRDLLDRYVGTLSFSRLPPSTYQSGVISGVIKAVYLDDINNHLFVDYYIEIVSVLETGCKWETSIYMFEIGKVRSVMENV
jgi:hypothetical protein